MKKSLIFIGLIIFGNNLSFAQATAIGNGWNSAYFLGYNGSNGTNPLTIRTNGITRMHINGATGPTSGFVGIGTSSPLAPMHIVGFVPQNAQGWRRGIVLGNASTLLWDGGGGQSFFMAHPSSSPSGNWFAGSQAGLSSGAAVDYAISVFVNDDLGSINPLRSTQILKNLLVFQPNFGRRLGVNTLNPQLASEVYSNTTQLRLSYGPAVSTIAIPSVYTDFQTNSFGNQQIMPTGGRVGINLGSNPTATLDVDGDARIRNVQQATPDALFVGVQAAGASDLNVRRLDFTGDANDVLLGDGTWGTIPNPPVGPVIGANNGCSKVGNNIQLGEPYNNPKTVPLLGNREVFLDDNYLVFTGKGAIGIGQTFPALPTQKLDVVGNARFRGVPANGGQSIVLGLQQGANPNDIILSRLAFPNDDTQVLLGDGTWGTVDGGTDDQNLTSATLNGTILTVSIENGSPISVNLADLQDGIGTDDQNLTSAVLNGNILTISIENGAPVSVDLSALQAIDTDNQLLNQPTIDCNTGILTLGIQDGNNVQVDLSCLMGSGVTGAVHNGLSSSTTLPGYFALGQNLGGTGGQLLNNREVPMNNQNIYFTDDNSTSGNSNRIGIGTSLANARLHVKVNEQISVDSPKGFVIDHNQNANNGIAQGMNINMAGSNLLNTGAWLVVNGATEANTGLDTRISGGNTTNGVFGRASDAIISGNGIIGEAISTNFFTTVNSGVKGAAYFGQTNYGGFFRGSGNSNGQSINTYGIFTTGNGIGNNNYGIWLLQMEQLTIMQVGFKVM